MACGSPLADVWSRNPYRGADDSPCPRQFGERRNTPCTSALLRLVANSAPCAPRALQGPLVELMNISSTNELNVQPLGAATSADRPCVFQPSRYRVRISTLIWNSARAQAAPGAPHRRLRHRASAPPPGLQGMSPPTGGDGIGCSGADQVGDVPTATASSTLGFVTPRRALDAAARSHSDASRVRRRRAVPPVLRPLRYVKN